MKNKWEQIATRWQDFSAEAQKRWSQLTDLELSQVNGNRNTLASVIQKRYFISRKVAHSEIETWIETLKI